MGQSLYEYSHPCDHSELQECLVMKPNDENSNERHPCNFFLRMKCTLTSKGRKVNLKSASYKVMLFILFKHCIKLTCNSHFRWIANWTINSSCSYKNKQLTARMRLQVIHCTGHLIRTELPGSSSPVRDSSDESEDYDDISERRSSGVFLVAVGSPIPHPSNIEIPLGRHTFLSKHSLNMKFTYADDKWVSPGGD